MKNGTLLPWSEIPPGTLFLHKCGSFEVRVGDRHAVLDWKTFLPITWIPWSSEEDEPKVRVVGMLQGENLEEEIRVLIEGFARMGT